jgi:hypothetical protein
MDLSATQEIPDLEVTNIRRRKDGLFLVDSNGETVLSLTERQMTIVLAVVSGGNEIRSGLRDIVFHRPRMKFKNAARQGGKKVYSAPVPMTPSQRASLCRTIRRVESLGLIETHGSQDVEPTESGLAIAEFLCDHPEVLGEDEELLFWVKTD